MRQLDLRGAVRGKTRAPPSANPVATRPADLVKRQFRASAPNRLWVADLTYLRTGSGWVYAAFVIDVYSRMIVGWQLAACRHRCVGGRWGRDAAGGDLRRGAGLAVCGIMDGMYRLGNLPAPRFGLGWRVPRV